MHTIYLTKRNLLTLLNKLDRPESKRTIIKQDTVHPDYPCTAPTMVVAVGDDDYYTDRGPGDIHRLDDPE